MSLKLKVKKHEYLKQELLTLLQEDRGIFDFFQHAMLDGIWFWDLENPENEWMNDCFWTTLGYTPEEMDDSPEAWKNIIFTEDLTVAEENFRRHLEDPEYPYSQVVRYKHKEGHTVWIHCRGIAIRDENGNPYRMLGAHHDVSILKNTEFLLNEEQQRFELAVNSAEIGVWDWDLISNELNWNENMHAIYETPFHVKEHKLFYDFWLSSMHPDDLEETINSLQAAVVQGERWSATFRIKLSDGNIKYIKASALIQIDKAKTPVRVTGINIDVTQQKTVERSLQIAAEAEGRANKAKSEFLANMSHEIRTPMNGVLGSLQLLQRRSLDVESNKIINNAIYSTHALLRIINDILDYSKIESGQLIIEYVDFSIKQVAESVISDILPIATQKGISVEIHFEKNMNTMWIGDPVRVRQIIMNLVSNGVKFTTEGGINIQFRHIKGNGKSGLVIDISDSGIGMSKQTVAKLFERFSQADASITRKYGGSGLGMSITNNLVSLMKGDIKVVSTEGKGTKFIVFLPLEQSDELEDNSEKIQTSSVPDLKNKVILVAEDHLVNQEIIKSMLELTNAQLFFAENGQIAVDMFSEVEPDIVLMDIQMPLMDGKEAFLLIRKLDDSVPVLALTANVMSHDIEEYSVLGFTGHIGKPFDIQELYHNLSAHLL